MKKPLFSLLTKKDSSGLTYEKLTVEIYPIWLLLGIFIGLVLVRLYLGKCVVVEVEENYKNTNKNRSVCFNGCSSWQAPVQN